MDQVELIGVGTGTSFLKSLTGICLELPTAKRNLIIYPFSKIRKSPSIVGIKLPK